MRGDRGTSSVGGKQVLPTWGAWLIYVALTVVMTWPLVTHLGSKLGGADQDMLNVYWGNWWIPRALAAGTSPYTTDYLIYPIGFDLTSFAFSPVLSIVALPFTWLLSPIVAYNFLLWIVIIFSCVAMDQLVRYLTGNPWAALVAGVTFGFSPILAGHRATHLNMATVVWLPWAALLMLRLLRQARVWDALLLAVVAALAFLTRLQVGILAALFCGMIFVVDFLTSRGDWHRLAWRRLVLATAIALILLSPLLLRVGRVMSRPDAGGVVREVLPVQADVLSYLTPVPEHPVFGRWTGDIYEHYPATASLYWTYIGVAPLILALCGVIAQRRRALPWFLAGLCFFVVALGTSLRVGGEVYPQFRLPYGVAPRLFAAMGFDSPDRFDLAMIACVAVLAGLGCDWLIRWLGARVRSANWPLWFPTLSVLLIAFEYAVIPTSLLTPPPSSDFYAEMAADDETYAVVDFPLTRAEGEIHRYYQTLHQKPIVGGWDHRVPASVFEFIESNALLSGWLGTAEQDADLARSLDALAAADVRYIIVHKDQPGTFPAALQHLYLAVSPIYEDGEIYVLPTRAAATGALNVVRTFDRAVDLIQPIVMACTVNGVAALQVETCWTPRDKLADAGLSYDVVLTDASGSVLATVREDVSGQAGKLECRSTLLPIDPLSREELHHVTISAPASDVQSDGYTLSVPVQFAGGEDDVPVPWVGQELPVTLEAPIEMLGFRLQAGEDVLLVDTYWRGTEDHSGSYEMFMQLLDPVSGLPVARSNDDTIPNLTWKESELTVDHRVLMVNDVAPGQYRLAVGVYRSGMPGKRLAATLGSDGSLVPGGQIVLEDAVLVLPRDWRTVEMSPDGRTIVYTTHGSSGMPSVARRHRFGETISLLGNSLPDSGLVCGMPFDLALTWETGSVPPVAYKVFVHVVDAAGQMVAQHDGDPASGQRPMTSWHAGDRVLDVHTVPWVTDACPESVQIRVGLYDPQTGERLPVLDEHGAPLVDDQVILGSFPVQQQ